MELRLELIKRALRGESISDLSREYGISRKTAHKFIKRFETHGMLGLKDYSRAPLTVRHRINLHLEKLILDTKKKYKYWGPKKIKVILEEGYPGVKIPAASTIGRVLESHGLVKKRRKRNRGNWPRNSILDPQSPNKMWSADFKGQFKTGNQKYCYPLTISDNFSRYILGIEALERTSSIGAIEFFDEIFREYGLPEAIKTDNGVPFAYPQSKLGLSNLSVFWLKHGVYLERIVPGKPQQNGKHERMHLTLKEETTRPPAENILMQQEKLDEFRDIFNEKRPHEALNMQKPSELYKKSKRSYDPNLELSYPLDDLTKKVYKNGSLYLRGLNKRTFEVTLPLALAGEFIGLVETEEQIFDLYFNNLELGFIDYKTEKLYFNEEWIYR